MSFYFLIIEGMLDGDINNRSIITLNVGSGDKIQTVWSFFVDRGLIPSEVSTFSCISAAFTV